jgi:hypothetical protein
VKKEIKSFQLNPDLRFSRTQEEVGTKALYGHDRNEH